MSEESTTPDLVAVVTGLFEAADRADWDAALSPYAPEVVWESGDGITDAVGTSEVRRLWEGWVAAFEDFTIRVENVVDLGNGVVYTAFRMEGRPAGSSGLVALRNAHIYEWVDGMIARVIVRRDIDEARAMAERLAKSKD